MNTKIEGLLLRKFYNSHILLQRKQTVFKQYTPCNHMVVKDHRILVHFLSFSSLVIRTKTNCWAKTCKQNKKGKPIHVTREPTRPDVNYLALKPNRLGFPLLRDTVCRLTCWSGRLVTLHRGKMSSCRQDSFLSLSLLLIHVHTLILINQGKTVHMQTKSDVLMRDLIISRLCP